MNPHEAIDSESSCARTVERHLAARAIKPRSNFHDGFTIGAVLHLHSRHISHTSAREMPSESTPLIQRVPVAEPRQRYPHQWLRRACTAILIASLIVVPLVFFLVPGARPHFGHGHSGKHLVVPGSWPRTNGLKEKELFKIISETPRESKAREWSQYYTAGPHLMGKNLSQAEWTRDRWEQFGIKSEIVSYEVYANYPEDHRLALLHKSKKGKSKVLYEASLEEDVLKEDYTTGLNDRVPTFHGYSASGNVTAQYVYCNYGTFYDYEEVLSTGIDLKGKIALVKYGHVFRGLKVKRAQELGMVGVVMFTDPGDDPMQDHDAAGQYPQGPARNPSSVQRGSTQFLSQSYASWYERSANSRCKASCQVILPHRATHQSLAYLAQTQRAFPRSPHCRSPTWMLCRS